MYKPADFGEMKYDVFADWTMFMWQQYEVFKTRPLLSEVPMGVFMDDEVIEEKDVDRLLRYAILYCSRQGNPLARELDLNQRRETIWTLLHISKKDPLRGYVEHWHPWVTKVMISYLRLENDMEYGSWLTDKIAYYQYLEFQMLDPMTSEDPEKTIRLKSAISQLKPDLEKRLKEKENFLFPDTRMRDEISEMEARIQEGRGGFAEFVVARPFPRTMEGDPSKMK